MCFSAVTSFHGGAGVASGSGSAWNMCEQTEQRSVTPSGPTWLGSRANSVLHLVHRMITG